MAGEFTKPTSVTPAIVGNIANPDEYNQNIAAQSKSAIVGIDEDGDFSDVNIGDETLGTNGTLITDIKLREGGALKFYNSSGVLQTTVDLILYGQIVLWASSSVPSGYLECNGAEVAVSTYEALTTAIYVGDSDNSDTDLVFGYKTDGSGTRSTSGTHIKIPDLRGEFVRGWDNSRGIDSDRVLGSYQDDELKSHTHRVKQLNSAVAGSIASVFRPDGSYSNDVSNGIESTGGDETRPRNISLMYIIKY